MNTEYQIILIVLSTGETKTVPTPYNRSELELLRYCNDLNENCVTYGTVYYLKPL